MLIKSIKRYLELNANKMWAENKRILLNLLAEEAPASKILDIGCGDGSFSEEVQSAFAKGGEALGVEISKELAKSAKDKVEVILADANKNLPFKDQTFDIVIANQLIEHLSDTDRFVKEVYRVLRVAGVFVCSTMNLASFHNIFSLVLGNQPFASHVSDEVTCGTLLDLEPRKDPNPYYGKKHRRVFTAPALKELLEFHGFKCESLTGWGLYPLPVAVGRFFRLPRYSVYLTVKARKPFS